MGRLAPFVTFCCPSIASGRIAGPRGKKAEGNDSCTREGKPGQLGRPAESHHAVVNAIRFLSWIVELLSVQTPEPWAFGWQNQGPCQSVSPGTVRTDPMGLDTGAGDPGGAGGTRTPRNCLQSGRHWTLCRYPEPSRVPSNSPDSEWSSTSRPHEVEPQCYRAPVKVKRCRAGARWLPCRGIAIYYCRPSLFRELQGDIDRHIKVLCRAAGRKSSQGGTHHISRAG